VIKAATSATYGVIVSAARLTDLSLFVAVKLVRKELNLVQMTSRTEITKYRVALFRELEPAPNRFGTTSHGEARDDKRGQQFCSSASVMRLR
jgi:hypothetical protein